MDGTLKSYAMRAVPRYTSYPTAPHFSDAVGSADARAWLAASDAGAHLSVYLHVPFCRQMCAYCGCHTKITKQNEPLIDYATTLRDEIRLVGDLVDPGAVVHHIHWGGGTPSLLPADQLMAIAADLGEAFRLDSAAEHAMELDPRSVTPDLVACLTDIGVNRVSLGVQDFEPSVQEAIGRVQPYDLVRDVMAMLRDAGIAAINFDLIYGLPRQTLASFNETAELAADLDPSRIALFGYAHVPWFKKHQRLIDEAELPGAQARIDLEAGARAVFERRGYRAIGLDHFARPGDPLTVAAETGALHRNFQGYTTDDADVLIGLGASSISKYPQGYAQNAPDLGSWRRAVANGEMAIAKGKAFTADDLVRGRIIEHLMTNYRADFAPLIKADPATEEQIRADLAVLAADGLAEVDGTVVTVRAEARMLVRIVAAVFDAYLQSTVKRHSVAV